MEAARPADAGTKVSDLSRRAPGQFATMCLGDLGDDVLLIEAPPGATSEINRPWADKDQARDDAFDPLRRNKRSLVLNLKETGGQEILHKLVAQFDVVIEGFRPGVISRLGCDYETLNGINPRILLCSLSGYGQTGPYAAPVAHDINHTSLAGMPAQTGRPRVSLWVRCTVPGFSGPPTPVSPPFRREEQRNSRAEASEPWKCPRAG